MLVEQLCHLKVWLSSFFSGDDTNGYARTSKSSAVVVSEVGGIVTVPTADIDAADGYYPEFTCEAYECQESH